MDLCVTLAIKETNGKKLWIKIVFFKKLIFMYAYINLTVRLREFRFFTGPHNSYS
jgi:hypothetical protein